MAETEKTFYIDPGTSKCGWAFFNDGVLEASGLITESGDKFERCSSIAKTLFYLVSLHQPHRVVCEYPHKGGAGAKSMHITILFHLCGMIHGYMDHIDVLVEFVEPSRWKGQVPKDKHQPKIIRKLKAKYGVDGSEYAEDTLDAIGIGLWDVWERDPNEKPSPEDE